jgi:2'-hydroxyisoflavone reductase
MKILILGGTQFVGLHLVQACLAAGHQVTLFNRGKSGGNLFPEVERLIGDRESDLSALVGKSWDAVIDVSGYIPQAVSASATLLSHAVERYVYISTIMVYADYSIPMQDEAAPLARKAPGEGGPYEYGLQKALCEIALEPIMAGRTLTIRPGFIAGPHDYTDRFTSWARRARMGGKILAPGNPDVTLQYIDVRDLVAFTLAMLEKGENRAFNVNGPATPLSWREFLEACIALNHSIAELTWVDAEFLRAHGQPDWSIPLWPPPRDQSLIANCDCRRALAAGLKLRPLQDTICDALAWDDEFGSPVAGLSPQREEELLRAWHDREIN